MHHAALSYNQCKNVAVLTLNALTQFERAAEEVVNLRLLSSDDPLVRGATQTFMSFPDTPVAITET